MHSNSELGGGGQYVKMDSDSYDVILNVLVGVKRSLSDLTDVLPKKLDDYQYVKKLTMESDWITSRAQRRSTYKFTDYAPLAFQKIRHLNKINENDYIKSMGPEQIINSLWSNNTETLYELCSSGKSGALFYYTKDKQYMLKSIAGREFKKLFAVLKDYVQHLSDNPDSLMTKFYGMYRLEWQNPSATQTCGFAKPYVCHLIVMENLFRALDVGIRFDLKGSKAARTRLKEGESVYSGRDTKVSLKDNDFREHFVKIQFEEKFKQDMPDFHLVIRRDVDFLTRNNLIDYSFLVGEVV